MPPSNQLPASLRYLKARLRPLTRPPVWGGAIFVSVVGLVAWEYSVNPELLQSSEHSAVVESEKSNNPSLSPEDSAIGADIDSSPVLAKELNQVITPPTAPLIPLKTQTPKNKDLFGLDPEKATSSSDTQLMPDTVPGTPATPAPTSNNPFLVQAQNLLQTGQLYDRESSLGNPYAASTQPNAGQTSGSSLGNGLPAVANQNQTASNDPLLNQSPLANPARTISQGSANALGQSFPASAASSHAPLPTDTSNPSSYTQPTVASYTQPTVASNTYPANSYYPPGVQIAPSVAPYSAPPVAPAPIGITPYSTQIPNQTTGSYPNPTFNSGSSSNLQQSPSQLQQYFSAPQANQRRPIGGGQVNTFGNP